MSAQKEIAGLAEAPANPTSSSSRKERSDMAQRIKDDREKQCQSYSPQVFEDARAFEASLDNGILFTRAFFEKAAEQVEIIRKGDPNMPFMFIPCVVGGEQVKKRVPPCASPAVSLGFSGVFIAASDIMRPAYHIRTPHHQDTKYDFSDTRALKPDSLQSTHEQASLRCSTSEEYKGIPKALETSMLRSRFWASVREQLDALTVPVDNIVCVALGTMHGTEEEGRKEDTSATQHVLACAISTYLSQRYAATSTTSSTPTPIPIVARDTAYKREDMVMLSQCNPPITVVSEPYQYLSITPSTLLISLYQPAFLPVFQVAADMCFPTSPAAIITAEILSHPWHKEGKIMALDTWTPRVGRMLECMDATWLGREFADDCLSPDDEGRFENAGDLIDDWGKNLTFYARKE
ncbi:hypothetical protein J4E83_011056 [Alternaria metachromatica]|uniref:uncharacterized protein n=1 Tax=Alternaria metachromatica TaxID=283354 RepID=UPI0020C1C6CD|nr:uncharacterized protein J4E83_011056 [Alternaria metachromatica]KAI4604637.1 hypothetical protein J4E83_011056 [Alternaria metachromatica]